MRFATLTTLLLGAALRATAQTSDPAQVAAVIARVQGIPATAAAFNTFNGREVRFQSPSAV